MTTLSHANILKKGKYSDLEIGNTEISQAKNLLKFMIRLRLCEQMLADEYHPADEMRCPVHFCIGQEAIPAALSLLLNQDDYLFSHHRSHGYFLAKNGPMKLMFAEIYGKETGANGGIAGSQDISYAKENFYSGAILAGATSIAMGAALGIKLQGLNTVAVAGFGESATDEGIFWETVNYAAYANLPVVFVCENNKYSVFSPQEKRSLKDNLTERVRSFGLRSKAIYGNDVMSVYRTLADEITNVRNGKGPVFIEAYTYRWNGHYGPESDDLVGYRDALEIETWKMNCPISLLRDELIKFDNFSFSIENEWKKEIINEIKNSFIFAKISKFPQVKNWNDLNISPTQIKADKFLHDVNYEKYIEEQNIVQTKGY